MNRFSEYLSKRVLRTIFATEFETKRVRFDFRKSSSGIHFDWILLKDISTSGEGSSGRITRTSVAAYVNFTRFEAYVISNLLLRGTLCQKIQRYFKDRFNNIHIDLLISNFFLKLSM